MATLVAHSPTDMTDWAFLGDIVLGTVSAATSTEWNVVGPGEDQYAFTGDGLLYGLTGLPIAGTIRGFTLSAGGVSQLAISGAVSALAFATYAVTGDAAGLQAEWFKGRDIFNGSTGNDHLLGYSGDDLFRLDNGGSDTVDGGGGDDTMQMRGAFGTTDRIDGGNGIDTVRLNADYFIVFTEEMLKSVETVTLSQGKDYVLHFVPGNVSKDGLAVDGSMLHAGALEVYMDRGARGFTATGGDRPDIFGGAKGDDTFTGNDGGDRLSGGGGADRLAGGAGRDVFVYGGAKDSTGSRFDAIADFDSDHDVFELDVAVAGVDAAFKGGELSATHFNAQLEKAVGEAVLGAGHAVLFTPEAGDFDGRTFLVVDANGAAGYQGGKDLVILFEDASRLDGLGIEDFLLAG
jgi:Ca2+-binding RTX toxin-like protein